MAQQHNPFGTFDRFALGSGDRGGFHSLVRLEEAGLGRISRLPISLRIVLESVLRNCDGKRVREADVAALAAWRPRAERTDEVPFVVARILLQDFTGVPLVVDLAAMRSAAARMDHDPGLIEPLVPVDLVVDHSVQVDYSGVRDALRLNMEMEFKRNRARYQFLKWGRQAFNGFNVVPPGIGIVHQVNLEYLARGVLKRGDVYYPDTLVGTDSHTTMVNGLGIVGWGVGGIEAEAGMLGQPLYILTPDVVGVHMQGALRDGVTATDLVLHVTEMLRKARVVGKFVEFHGDGAASLTTTDRATIGNMAPEYGATVGYFPVDENACRYLEATGRPPEQVDAFRRYFQAQGMFGMPRGGEIDYSEVIELDLDSVRPAISGPRRPQDRIDLADVNERFAALLGASPAEGGYGIAPGARAKRFTVRTGVSLADRPVATPLTGGGEQATETAPNASEPCTSDRDTNPDTEIEMMQNRPTPDRVEEVPPGEFARATVDVGHGDVVIAAITSCTNTSNPAVMVAAGLLARNAVARGLRVRPTVKTSLAPGSRVVTEYLRKLGLADGLDALGFQTVGYGCTTCIGNSGPLEPHLEEAITGNNLVVASVLSGNRNFEARVHQNIKANFLMSPPLVVAYALAGTMSVDLVDDPLGQDDEGRDVYLRDLWPTAQEVQSAIAGAADPEAYRTLYGDLGGANELWSDIESPTGKVYAWDDASTYIQEPPYFDRFSMSPEAPGDIVKARALAVFGDSVTTDHISPAGAIKANSPAGLYLQERGVEPRDFNSYGSRRGNHHVMVRGTFANVRIRNRMVPGVEGGFTVHYPSGEQMSIYDAAVRYQSAGTPLLVFAGEEYGTGSSRDWAAKGTRLLGVRAVVATSFERIHRSNLVGMGVLPLQFRAGQSATTLALTGEETFEVLGIAANLTPRMDLTLVIHRPTGERDTVPVTVRIDTPVEVDYYLGGGILPYVLRQLVRGE
ncbi:MAG: aconitate hydratase [Chthonomonadales bacterium]|nr:aconitate hydratase [Chthonomonadales bacterium]